MDGKVLAGIVAAVFVVFAIMATIIELAREEPPAVSAPSAPSLQPNGDPLREGQRRCQLMGEAAVNDEECLHIWAETRDRFLGRAPAPATPAPNEGQ